MPKILFHQRVIPAYQVSIMEEFCKYFNNTKIVYGNEKKKENLKNGPINSLFFEKTRNFYPLKNPSTFFTNLIPHIRKYKPQILITQGNIGNLSLLPIIIIKPFFKYKLILWGHGWNRVISDKPGNSLSDMYRAYIQRKSDALILYSQESKEILKKTINENKLFVANNSMDTVSLNKTYQLIAKTERSEIKKKLNLSCQYYITFLGRLTYRKNLESILNIIKTLNNKEIGVNFIGDGEAFFDLKKKSELEKIPNVNFYGEVNDQLLIGQLLYCSNLQIIPRSVGLSALHSFIFELPVMVLEDIGNGPEIDFIKHDKNGFLMFEKDQEHIAAKIKDFFNDVDLQKKLKQGSRETIENEVNTEKFLLGFSQAINYTLNKVNE